MGDVGIRPGAVRGLEKRSPPGAVIALTRSLESKAMSKREKRLDRALRVAIPVIAFYMNPETYFAISFIGDRPAGQFLLDFGKTDLGHKPGKKARKAFKRIQQILEVLD